MKTYTFHTVMISVQATSGKQAYTKLCNALAKAGDFVTDEYSVNDCQGVRSTRGLFPTLKDSSGRKRL